MTLHRVIKWLTILMLALSLAIAGAWVWGQCIPPSKPPNSSASMGIVVLHDGEGLVSFGKAMHTPSGDTFALVGSFDVDIQINGSIQTPVFWNDSLIRDWLPWRFREHVSIGLWTPSEADPLNNHYPITDVAYAEMIELACQDFESTATHDSISHALLYEALGRGPGTRTRIWWPGVAQRVRIHAPRALALTGLLTLAGFTTLFVQRRRRRDRMKSGYCGACGYDLRGLTAAVCPECGRDAPSPEPPTAPPAY